MRYLETGKSFAEALILALANPKHDKRLFIELRVQYKLRTCVHKLKQKQYVYTSCSELVSFLY